MVCGAAEAMQQRDLAPLKEAVMECVIPGRMDDLGYLCLRKRPYIIQSIRSLDIIELSCFICFRLFWDIVPTLQNFEGQF